MNVDKIRQNKLTPKIVLLLIIFIQLTRIVYNFAFVKQDYHPDETWSFGLANSYYEPYIYQDANETGPTHSGYWFSAEELKNYLTVEPEHRFSYSSVFYNQTKDLHPPLYYLILHTICSLFPGQFSFWFGFVINVIAFAILQIYLYRLSKEVMKSEILALITCTYFGFTSGALCMFVFVRMYALATMFAVMSAFYHARLYNDNNLKRNLPVLFFITFAGALTHHYYLVYAGVLSACFCFYYLFKKKIKYLIGYSVVLLSSVGLSILVFPATIHHAFGRRGKISKLPVELQSVMSLNCITGELAGIQFKIGKTPILTKLACVLITIAVILLPLCFLFRKEEWFKKFIAHIKEQIMKMFINLKSAIKAITVYPAFLLIVSIAVWIVVFNSISMYGMGSFTDRYLFIIYPIFCVCIVILINVLIKTITLNKNHINLFVTIVCVSFSLLSNQLYPCIYLLPVDKTIRGNYKEADIIYITVADNLLTQISKDVLDSNMIYMNKPDLFVENEFQFPIDDENFPVFLLLDDSCLYTNDDSQEEILNDWLQIAKYSTNKRRWSRTEFESIIIEKNPLGKCEYIGQDFIAGYPTSVYRIR